MLGRRRRFRLDTERLVLRPPQHGDFNAWVSLRVESQAYLTPWEPSWAHCIQQHL